MIQGERGLPSTGALRFAYRVDWRDAAQPHRAEMIIILWCDEPEMDEDALYGRALVAVREMVEVRGRGSDARF